jgi:beta-N-acetylhexosaminidase
MKPTQHMKLATAGLFSALIIVGGAVAVTAKNNPVPVGTTVRRNVTTSAVASSTAVATTSAQASAKTCPDAASLSDRAAARQLLMLGFTNEADSRMTTLAKNGIGGFFVMGSRRTPDGIKRATEQVAAIRSGATAGGLAQPFIATDEEGGRVQRFVALGKLPPARELGAKNAAAIRTVAKNHGDKLKNLGLNMDFAPVLDLDGRATGVIADRSFSPDPAKAFSSAYAFAQGLSSAGLTPVYKHFPGHGSASGDSHKGLVTTPSLTELRKKDLLPFASAIQAGATVIMMGHLLVPGLTDSVTPTTWTPAAYQELRTMGFTGVIMSDDLGMGALAAEPTVGRRASRSIAAGADMVLYSTTAGAELILDQLVADMKSGKLPRARVNDAVSRTLKLRCSN